MSQIKSFCHKNYLTWQKFLNLIIKLESALRKWNRCSFGHKLSHFVTTYPDLKSKNFFYKSFSIRSIEYKNALRKMNWVFILSQIKSFCHNLFLTYDQKTSFANVFQFSNLDKKISWEKWNVCSFGHNYVISSHPVPDLK